MKKNMSKEVCDFPRNEELQEENISGEAQTSDLETPNVEYIAELVKVEVIDKAVEEISSIYDIEKNGSHTCISTTDADFSLKESIPNKDVCAYELNPTSENLGYEQQQTLTNSDVLSTLSIPNALSITDPADTLLEEADTIAPASHFLEGKKVIEPDIIEPNLNRKCHNLSVSQLRKKLAFCPICQIQYSNHKMANMCLAKHGKRQCWLCLEILSSKKEDFYRHCMEFHSISKIGDIVGCPFCGKCFDFRQGLNQHIVKIHFAESISDLEAVASLSPQTLVDIFTGKPRSSSSSSEEILSHKQLRPNDDKSKIPGADADSSIGQKYNDGLSDVYVESAKELTYFSPATIFHHQQMRGSYNADSFPHTNIPLISRQAMNVTVPNISRPSVIAMSCSSPSVHKMSVPPEQTMSSLSLAMGTRSLEYSLQPNLCYSGENNVEVVENTSFPFQKYVDDSLNYMHGKSFSFPTTQMKTVSNLEKFDISPFSEFSDGKISPISSTFGGKEVTIPYEKAIMRVCSAPGRGNSQLESKFELGITEANNSKFLSSNNQPNTLDGIPSFATDITFNNSIGRMLKTIADTGFNDQISQKPSKMLYSTTKLENLVENEFLSTAETCQKAGGSTTLNPEIEQHCGVPKLPDNCGVKRRILMKAMWDERQFKKPAQSHALVHDLQAAASLISQPRPTCHKSLDNLVTAQNQSYCYNNATSLTNDETQPFQQTHLLPPKTYALKDAGPFFEQYVNQDKSREWDPFKLLDLARNPALDPSKSLDASSRAWGNSAFAMQAPSDTLSTMPTLNSCARYESATSSRSVGRSSCAGGTNSQSLPCTNVRPYGGSTGYFRGRRPPNPAFWDNLRARLMVSQNTRHACGVAQVPYRSQFYTPATYLDCCFSRNRQSIENIVVQNPFDDETEQAPGNNGGHVFPRAKTPKGTPGNANQFDTSRFCKTTCSPEFSQSSAPGATTFTRHHPYLRNVNDFSSVEDSTIRTRLWMQPKQHCYQTSQPCPNSSSNANNPSTSPKSYSTSLFSPRYAEEYHQILNRLHSLDRSKPFK